MPRRVRKPERLNDSINVPVPHTLKRRVIAIAKGMEGKPPHTRVARKFIEQGVKRFEDEKPAERTDEMEPEAAATTSEA